MAPQCGPRDHYHHGDLAEALLQAVETLADRFGIEAVTLRGCAREAGVSPSSAFRHYADKRALMTAFASRAIDMLVDQLEGAFGDDASHPSPMVRIGLAYVRFALEHPAFYRAMWREEAINVHDGAYRAALGRLEQRLMGGFVGAIADQDAAALDADELLVWSAVHGVAELMINGPLSLKGSNDKRLVEAERMLERIDRLWR